jgi:anti-anti-sigma factor
VHPRPARTASYRPQTEADTWFFCLRYPAENGSVRVAMVGELDLASAARAARAIRGAQRDGAAVICDLGDLSFIDVCGLHVLVDASAYARRTGARLSFVHHPAFVYRHLAMLGLAGALDMHRGSRRSPLPGRNGCDPGNRRARVRLVGPRQRR